MVGEERQGARGNAWSADADEKAKAEEAKQFLVTYPPIQNLPVVKDRRFVELVDGLAEIGGFRNAEGVKIVARALHPAAFR